MDANELNARIAINADAANQVGYERGYRNGYQDGETAGILAALTELMDVLPEVADTDLGKQYLTNGEEENATN